jgi:uncharacterized protein Yka (UPF0111/DUF47 family)
VSNELATTLMPGTRRIEALLQEIQELTSEIDRIVDEDREEINKEIHGDKK